MGMSFNQYDIVLVNLDPTVGSEIRKTRPCVVVSPNEMNLFLKTIVIVPMTTSTKSYSSRIRSIVNQKEGSIAIDQIRTIDKIRVLKVLDKVSTEVSSQIKEIIHEMFVL
jgi:mRNA interferase MazF